ncbi:MAG TPA: carboxypeptidase-like regulatory domain-containing protein, partial [Bacteroidales bacterium]|nr:carboxypeptidase-like regulatory domain-containing protein [Bacteroidales bacterium]HPS28084.1 carboxypeptidase-like regulatory domain-containing protein [Bacteroidales bacterium]
MKKTLLFHFVFLCCTFLSLAQQATIKGTIFNGKSKETIPGVNIILDEKTGVASDMDGRYSLKVNAGKVTITYKYIGYTPVVRIYELKPGQTKIEDIELY